MPDSWQRLGDVAERIIKSERWGILATRSSGSMLGVATAWCVNPANGDRSLLLFDTEAAAQAMAHDYNTRAVSPNISYRAERFRL